MEKANVYENFKKKPISEIISYILFLLSVILVAASTKTHDYISYSKNYYGYMNSNFEVGYTYISNFLFSLGVSFDIFKLITMGIGMILIRSTAKKILGSEMLWIYYILYMIYPLALDSPAIRNTLAMSITIFAFPYLIDKKRGSGIKYMLLIFVASLFHGTARFYYLLIVLRIYNKQHSIINKLLRLSFAILILNAIIMSLYKPYLTIVLNIMEQFLVSNDYMDIKKTVYFDIVGNFGFLLFAGYQLLSIYVIKHITNIFESRLRDVNSPNKNENMKLYNFAKYLLYCDVLLLLLVPVYRVNSNYFRLFRNIIPLIYISILSSLRNVKSHKIKTIAIIALFFVATIVFAYLQIEPEKEIIFFTLFSDNWIINLFR